jgi:hypothetical protein
MLERRAKSNGLSSGTEETANRRTALLFAPANRGATMTAAKRPGADDRLVDRDTLIRLANSCDRAAARTGAASASLSDMDEEDYRTIGRILRKLAES